MSRRRWQAAREGRGSNSPPPPPPGFQECLRVFRRTCPNPHCNRVFATPEAMQAHHERARKRACLLQTAGVVVVALPTIAVVPAAPLPEEDGGDDNGEGDSPSSIDLNRSVRAEDSPRSIDLNKTPPRS